MSKKKINSRLKHIFDDVSREATVPPKQPRKLPGTGALSPSKIPTVRPNTGQPKPPTPRPSEPTVTNPAISDSTGTMSLAFRQDDKNWATLRVIDETASHPGHWKTRCWLSRWPTNSPWHWRMPGCSRTRNAQNRRFNGKNEYLAAAAEIGRLVTSTLDLNTIFSRTVNLVSERFGYYHAAIFVTEESGFNAVLREATGAAGAEMRARSHSLPINDRSVVGKVALTGEPVIINDTRRNSTHRPNPLLPETLAKPRFLCELVTGSSELWIFNLLLQAHSPRMISVFCKY